MTIAAIGSGIANRIEDRAPALAALAAASLNKTTGAAAASGTPPALTHPLLAAGLDKLDYHVHQVVRDHLANHSAAGAAGATDPAADSSLSADAVPGADISLPVAKRPLVAAAERNLKYHVEQTIASAEAARTARHDAGDGGLDGAPTGTDAAAALVSLA